MTCKFARYLGSSVLAVNLNLIGGFVAPGSTGYLEYLVTSSGPCPVKLMSDRASCFKENAIQKNEDIKEAKSLNH